MEHDDDNEGWQWLNWQTKPDNTYIEDNDDEFGVTHIWKNAKVLDKIITKRGTRIEMVERPKWGIACYMNNSIQSCEVDEQLYHETLVHPVMSAVENPKRVCIIGGGEGATAREVFEWPGVEQVDMYEWDEDVVNLFRGKYTQWGKMAWYESRLQLYFEDIFEVIKTPSTAKYDVIIIDLFEPTDDNRSQWETLLGKLQNWIAPGGAIVMYAGMRNILVDKQPYESLTQMLNETEMWRGVDIPKYQLNREITPYRVWIPSFSGESMFILLTPHGITPNFQKLSKINSHINEPVWNSYKTMNWR